MTNRRSWLSEEIKFLITISVFVTSVVLAYAGLKVDAARTDEKINNILTNHIPHINDAQTRQGAQLEAYNQQSIEQGKQITEILTILKSYEINP